MNRRRCIALPLLLLFLVLAVIFRTEMYAAILNNMSKPIITKVQPAGSDQAAQLVEEGKTALSNHDILTARNKFKSAVDEDPANQEAQFYYGVTRVFAIYEDGQDTHTAALDSLREILELSGFSFNDFGVYGTSAKTTPQDLPATAPTTGQAIAFLTGKALPEIDGAIANLEKVTNTAFSTTLQPAALKNASSNPVTIDIADVRGIKALIYALKTDLELMRVYNLNANLPSVVNGDTSGMMRVRRLLTGNSSFLTVADSSRLPVARAAMMNFIDSYTNAVSTMKARDNSGGVQHLFVIDEPLPFSGGNASISYDKLSAQLAEIRKSLSGPAELSFIHSSRPYNTVDLSRFFNASAPINIRSKIANCSSGTIFPDATFGGVLPYGLGTRLYGMIGHEMDMLGMACSNYTAPAAEINPYSTLVSIDKSGYSNNTANISLQNRGTGNLVFQSAQLIGPNKDDFQLGMGTCGSVTPTLAPGAECGLTVALKDNLTTNGQRIAFLELKNNDANHAVSDISISGSYYDPAITNWIDIPNPNTQSLKVTISGNGSVVMGSHTISPPGYSGSAPFGVSVNLTAQIDPLRGSKFTGWSGCDSYSGTECTVNMFSAKNVTATFAADTTKPTGTIAINDGAASTNSAAVTVILDPKEVNGSGVAYYCLSNSPITTCNFTKAIDYGNLNIPWTLAVGADGARIVYALFKDNAGNVSAAISDSILLDATAPTGTVKINNGAAITGSASVVLNLTAIDAGGISQMRFSNDNATWGAWVPFVTTYSPWTLDSSDGSKTVYVQLMDKSGNTSTQEIKDDIILDKTKPTATLSINAGADYTNKTAVTLALIPSENGSGLSQVRFSNNGTTWGAWSNSTVNSMYSWTLTAGDGQKTVYAQMKDKAGNISDVQISDNITLETTKPTDGIANLTALASDNALLLSWAAASDTSSGLKQYNVYYSTTAAPACSGTPLTTITDLNSLSYTHSGLNAAKSYYYRVCAVDNAGNFSTGKTASAKPSDAAAPTGGSVTINSGALYTKSAAVTLALGASDPSGVTGVCISNTASCATWLPYAATKPWSLSSGDGSKNVYVRFKDSKGNVSDSTSATITLDTTKPVDGSANLTASPSGDNALLLSWAAASDADNGLKQYNVYYSTTAAPACSGTPLTTITDLASLSYTHSGLSAAKSYYYRVCAVDKAGNFSVGKTASAKPNDVTAPTGTVTINKAGDTYTNKAAVTLALNASDPSGVTGVCISNTDASCTTWFPYAATKPWTLAAGDGSKNVYVLYRDSKGNPSPAPISASITLDTTKPAVSGFQINNNEARTKSATVNLTFQLSDANLTDGIDMQFSNNTTTWSPWTPFGTTPVSYTLAGTDGTKTVYARFRDKAGNISATVSDSIILDTKNPSLTITTVLPETTSLKSKEIRGTKDANTDVSITLNSATPITVSQSHAGTTWNATVGNFSEGPNTIDITATDDALNQTANSLTITYAPFKAADLQGTWRIVGARINGSDAGTEYGWLTFDDNSNITGVFPHDANIGGALVLNEDGTITSGTLSGTNLEISNLKGAMDINRSMLTVVGSLNSGGISYRGMLTAVKTGSVFAQLDVTGKWYSYGISGYNVTGMGSFIVADNGEISSGTLTNTFYSSTPTTATYTMIGENAINNDGSFISSPFTFYNTTTNQLLNNDLRQMSSNPDKNIVLIRGSDGSGNDAFSTKFLAFKDGGTFTTADLNGRWLFQGIKNSTTDPDTAGGYMDVAAGQITGGQVNITDPNGTTESITMTGGSLTLNTTTAPGTYTGSVKAGGQTSIISAGKLDSSKTIMVFMIKEQLYIGYLQR